MSLYVSKVPRSLETKARLFGFELADLLVVFLYLAISNLIFGATSLKLPLVWGGTLLLSTILFFVKRGKPDHYVQHLGEYGRTPAVLSAGAPDVDFVPYLDGDQSASIPGPTNSSER